MGLTKSSDSICWGLPVPVPLHPRPHGSEALVRARCGFVSQQLIMKAEKNCVDTKSVLFKHFTHEKQNPFLTMTTALQDISMWLTSIQIQPKCCFETDVWKAANLHSWCGNDNQQSMKLSQATITLLYKYNLELKGGSRCVGPPLPTINPLHPLKAAKQNLRGFSSLFKKLISVFSCYFKNTTCLTTFCQAEFVCTCMCF